MIVLSQGFIKSFLASACKKSNNVHTEERTQT